MKKKKTEENPNDQPTNEVTQNEEIINNNFKKI